MIFTKFSPNFTILLIGTLLIAGCATTKSSDQEPLRVVQTYFEEWNNQNYLMMYNLISDGFKSIEPTAKTLGDFKTYAKSQRIDGVDILSITQSSNNGEKATVDYDLEFIIENKKVPFKGTYTLKYKPNDTIPGWKLIHPYGENIDTT